MAAPAKLKIWRVVRSENRWTNSAAQIKTLNCISGIDLFLTLDFRSHMARSKLSSSTGGSRKKDRKSTRLNSSHGYISYAVFCLKKKKKKNTSQTTNDTITLPILDTSANMPIMCIII